MTHQRIQQRGAGQSSFPIEEFYYDNQERPITPESSIIRVERVYQFDLHAWNEADWDVLGIIYTALPGWQGDNITTLPREEQYPYWFGIDDQKFSALSASVEPHGIVFSGDLERVLWEQWQTAFHQHLRETQLPLYTYQPIG